jgi:hypothetical protein
MTKAMPLPRLAFPELLILRGVRQLFLAGINGGATRAYVQRCMTGIVEITMAISRTISDSLKGTKSAPAEKNRCRLRHEFPGVSFLSNVIVLFLCVFQ